MFVNRNQDLRMIAGRPAMDLEYDIGFDDSGKIQVSPACLFPPLPTFRQQLWLLIIQKRAASTQFCLALLFAKQRIAGEMLHVHVVLHNTSPVCLSVCLCLGGAYVWGSGGGGVWGWRVLA